MARSEGFCNEEWRNGGQLLRCDRKVAHGGAHHCPVWLIDWHPAGKFSEPRRRSMRPVCDEPGCDLDPKHKGPHYAQPALL